MRIAREKPPRLGRGRGRGRGTRVGKAGVFPKQMSDETFPSEFQEGLYLLVCMEEGGTEGGTEGSRSKESPFLMFCGKRNAERLRRIFPTSNRSLVGEPYHLYPVCMLEVQGSLPQPSPRSSPRSSLSYSVLVVPLLARFRVLMNVAYLLGEPVEPPRSYVILPTSRTCILKNWTSVDFSSVS